MKYVLFWEFDPADMNTVIKKWEKVKDIEVENLESISPNYAIGGEFSGFQIFEADNPDELLKYILHYAPEVKCRIDPIIEAEKVVEMWKGK